MKMEESVNIEISKVEYEFLSELLEFLFNDLVLTDTDTLLVLDRIVSKHNRIEVNSSDKVLRIKYE